MNEVRHGNPLRAFGGLPPPRPALSEGVRVWQSVGGQVSMRASVLTIDLGVVDPEAPGCYLLDIECDGANYHRAKTAHDRDKLRDGILRDLGWELHRIRSTD